MSAQTISPQKGAELGAVCRGLQLSNVTVRSARTAPSAASPVSVLMPLGRSTASTNARAFPLTIHQRTGSQSGRAKAAVKPGAIQSIHDGVKGLCCQRCRIAAFGDRQVCQACMCHSLLVPHPIDVLVLQLHYADDQPASVYHGLPPKDHCLFDQRYSQKFSTLKLPE